MCFNLVIKAVLTATLFLWNVLSCTYCKHGMNFQLRTTMKRWDQLLKSKSKTGSLSPHRQRLTFIVSVYTHLLSTSRAVCDISINFLWISFIAVCILVPRSNDSHNHTTFKTNKIHYNVSVLTYKSKLVEGTGSGRKNLTIFKLK